MRYFYTLSAILLLQGFSARGASFSPPATIATSSRGGFISSAAIDASGDMLVAWGESGPNDTLIPKARYRKAGGAWSAPVIIGPPSSIGQSPFVLFKASGGATAIMTSGTHIVETDMAPGGKWGKARKILETKAFPLFVTNSNGDEAIIAGLTAIRRGRGKQSWSAPVAIPSPPTSALLAVDNAALGPDGDLVVSMETGEQDCSLGSGCSFQDVYLYVARQSTPEAAWALSSALEGPLSSTSWQYFSLPLINGQHQAAVLFQNGSVAQAFAATASGWGSAADIVSASGSLQLVGAAINRNGGATAAFGLFNTVGAYVVADGNLATNAWSKPKNLSESDKNAADGFAVIGTNAVGGIALAWPDTNGRMRVAVRTQSDTPWQPLQDMDAGACAPAQEHCTYAEAIALNDTGTEIAVAETSLPKAGLEALRAASTEIAP